MPDVTDMELLQDYRQGSEQAFAELVQRHVNLVYSTALRHIGIGAHAEEITQAVFVILARKAAGLRHDTILEAWLYQTTRLTSLSFLRGEWRRQAREQEAYMQSTLSESTGDSTWNQIAPLLDEAMARLGKKDREAVVLRFFKEKNLREVAAALNVTEAAAQSRVHRALDKLRHYFSRHGVDSTTAIIAGGISAHSMRAAPAALAKSVTAVAVAKGAVASTSTLTLIKGTLKIMAWSKIKTAAITGAIVLLAAGTATVGIHQIEKTRVPEHLWRHPNINSDEVDKLPPEVKILPTAFPKGGNFSAGSHDDQKVVGIGQSIVNLVSAAYDWPQARVVFPDGEPPGKYDFIATLPQGSHQALQDELNNKLGLIGHPETENKDVLLLEMLNVHAPGIHPPTSGSYCFLHMDGDRVEIKWANQPISKISDFLQSGSKWPIVDETGAGNPCSIDIKWTEDPTDPEHTALQKVLRDQLGLGLVSTNMPIQMLMVEKSN